MHVPEEFLKVVRASIIAFAVVLAAFLLSDVTSPRHEASAQGSGTIGIQAIEVPVFLNAVANGCSGVLKDIGQGQNTLYVVTTTFTGTIDLEWTPNPVTTTSTYYPITVASYVADAGTHALSVSGYYPNLRSCVSGFTAGEIQAWYSASAGPIGIAPGFGSSGPTSIPVCDKQGIIQVATSTTGVGPVPVNSGDVVIVCGYSWSFAAATTTGYIALAFAPTGTCVGDTIVWESYTTSSTPQTLPISLPQRGLGGSGGYQTVCAINNSGATAYVNISYASVHL